MVLCIINKCRVKPELYQVYILIFACCRMDDILIFACCRINDMVIFLTAINANNEYMAVHLMPLAGFLSDNNQRKIHAFFCNSGAYLQITIYWFDLLQ